MAWNGLVLTVDGQNALNAAQLANSMNIKSVVVGDGQPPDNFRTQKGLVHQLYEITDLKVDVEGKGRCTVTVDIPKVGYDYYFREIGIIVMTDEGEKLYVYDNCTDDAQYIVSTTGAETTRKRIRLTLNISDVAEITVVDSGIMYVSYDVFEETKAQMEEGIKNNAENLDGHVKDTGNPHKVSREHLNIEKIDNTADMDKPVSTAQQAALDALYEQLAAYTRQQIANLINGAPSSLDTLKEVSDAIAAHKTIMDALDAAIGKKASAAEFDSHTKDTTKHITPTERTNWNDANTKKHTHGNKSVLDGITSTLISGWSAKMEKTGDSANNTVTFSSGDATNPTGWADIGVVASGEKHSSLWRKFSLAVKNIRYLYNLLTSGALSTLLGTNLTANRAVVANGNGKLAAAGVTATELGYLAGVKSKVQDQLNELNTGLYKRLYIALPFFNSDFSGSRNFNAGETVVLFFDSTYENDYIRFYRNSTGGGKYFDIKKTGYYRIIAHFGVAPGIYKMQLKNSANTVLYREACGTDRQTIELTTLFTSVASLMLLLTVNNGGVLYSDAAYSVVEFEYLGNY